MKKIALFANHKPGVDVANFFASRYDKETVAALYLPDESQENDSKIERALNQNVTNVFRGKEIMSDPDHLHWFKQQKFDALICVYWPWLLSKDYFSEPKITINFHPALLPINRGWFPHVHSLIDGSPAGVTLHQIADGADTGNVWVQKEVRILPTETAKDIYNRLQNEIFDIFVKNWESILSGNIKPFAQDESKSIYHKKNEINELDKIDMDSSMRVADLINLLRARSFGDKGFAYFESGADKIYLNLRLSKSMSFE